MTCFGSLNKTFLPNYFKKLHHKGFVPFKVKWIQFLKCYGLIPRHENQLQVINGNLSNLLSLDEKKVCDKALI